jgi:hypothetical protein
MSQTPKLSLCHLCCFSCHLWLAVPPPQPVAILRHLFLDSPVCVQQPPFCSPTCLADSGPRTLSFPQPCKQQKPLTFPGILSRLHGPLSIPNCPALALCPGFLLLPSGLRLVPALKSSKWPILGHCYLQPASRSFKAKSCLSPWITGHNLTSPRSGKWWNQPWNSPQGVSYIYQTSE